MPGAIVRPLGFAARPSIIPKLDVSSPITRGLIDAMLPVGPVVVRTMGDGRQVVMANNGTLTNSYDQKIGYGQVVAAHSTTAFTVSSTSAAMPGGFGSGTSCLKECAYLLLLRVVSSGTFASDFFSAYGNTGNNSPIFGFQIGPSNNNFIFYVRDNASGGQQVVGTLATSLVGNAFCVIGTRSESANFHRMYTNGLIDVNTTASATGTATFDNACFNNLRRSGVFGAGGGNVALVLVWNRALLPTEAVSLSYNPWQVFEVPPRPALVDAAAAAAFLARNGLNINQSINRASTF